MDPLSNQDPLSNRVCVCVCVSVCVCMFSEMIVAKKIRRKGELTPEEEASMAREMKTWERRPECVLFSQSFPSISTVLST